MEPDAPPPRSRAPRLGTGADALSTLEAGRIASDPDGFVLDSSPVTVTIPDMCVAPTPEQLVETAMALAEEAGGRGDPPFGALLVSPHGEVAVMASNRQVSGDDPIAHAELELLRAAGKAGHRPPLRGYTVVVNAEPCSMCASALVKAQVGVLIYGAPHEPHMDPDLDVAGVFARATNPPRVTSGVLAGEAAAQISAFRQASPPPD